MLDRAPRRTRRRVLAVALVLGMSPLAAVSRSDAKKNRKKFNDRDCADFSTQAKAHA